MSIERKKKICVGCNTPQYIWSKGRCKSCSAAGYNPIPKVSKQNKTAADIPEEEKSLAPFFLYHISEIEKNPFCMGCGCRISASHFHVAHVIPKSKYKSVKSNLHNAVYLCTSILGGNGCHDDFDKNCNDINWLLEFKAIDKILEAFNKFSYFVTERSGKEFRILEQINGEKSKKD